MKLLKILVILRGIFAMFLDTARFINQSIVSLSPGAADYTCWEGTSLKLLWESCIKETLFLSSKSSSVVILIFYSYHYIGYLQLRKGIF